MNIEENFYPSIKHIVDIPNELIDSGNIRYFAKNSEIYDMDKTVKKLCVIMSGKVKVINMSEDGKEFIVQYYLEGSFFGEQFLFNKTKPPSIVSTIAIEDSKICFIPSNVILTYSMKHPELLIDFLNVTAKKMCLISEQVNNIAFNNPTERIALVIYKLATSYGLKINESIELPFNFTHQELADLTNCTRVSITRALNNLKSKRILDIKKDQLIIYDMDRLKDISKFY